MPEQRLTRTRATLPEGYQFGDARPFVDPGTIERVYDVVMNRMVNVAHPHDDRPHRVCVDA